MTITKFEVVTTRFLDKIQKDKEFFNLSGLTDKEMLDIINKHLKSLLRDSISEMQRSKNALQQVNFLDYDMIKETFNFELTDSEQDLLSSLMVIKYYDEAMVELKAKQKYLGADINTFSPANERKTFIEMTDYKRKLFDKSFGTYNMVDRLNPTIYLV